jgi:hypothetical protein
MQDISNNLAMGSKKSKINFSRNDAMPVMEDEEKIKVGKIEIIELIDSDEEEPVPQQAGGIIRGLMNLVTLSTNDLATLHKNNLVNDACIDAMGDILQQKLDDEHISICHTGLWAAVRDHGWGDDPDPEDAENERWQAYKFTRENLQSKLLMIPCNFPGESEVEVGHWILAIREKGENGKHKLG